MEDAAEAWDAGGGVGGALLGLDASFEAGAATHADLSDLCDSEELAALATAHAAPHSYGRLLPGHGSRSRLERAFDALASALGPGFSSASRASVLLAAAARIRELERKLRECSSDVEQTDGSAGRISGSDEGAASPSAPRGSAGGKATPVSSAATSAATGPAGVPATPARAAAGAAPLSEAEAEAEAGEGEEVGGVPRGPGPAGGALRDFAGVTWNSSLPVAVLGLDMRVVAGNASFLEHSGFSADDLASGLSSIPCILPSDVLSAFETFNKLVTGQARCVLVPQRPHLGKGGRVVNLVSMVSLARDPDGSPRYFVLALFATNLPGFAVCDAEKQAIQL